MPPLGWNITGVSRIGGCACSVPYASYLGSHIRCPSGDTKHHGMQVWLLHDNAVGFFVMIKDPQTEIEKCQLSRLYSRLLILKMDN